MASLRICTIKPAGGRRRRGAVERLKMWPNGSQLKARFLDGDTGVQDRVAAIAKEWEDVVSLTLQFVRTGPAELRISFAEKDFSWSTVGTDALTLGRDEATMNYGWLEPDTELVEYQRVVRHEFGHALGMIHEHQNPTAKIPWDKPKVYAYYARQGWTRDDVNDNIFELYDVDTTNFTEFDPASIMEYAIPEELTIGRYSVGWNTELSPRDIEFMRRQYPGEVELTVGTGTTDATIAAAGDVNTFRFTVVVAATHVMTTTGAIDTVLALHGPGDPSTVAASDDDRGRGTNARIVRRLEAGTYWLHVRHKDPAGTGAYRIRVSPVR